MSMAPREIARTILCLDSSSGGDSGALRKAQKFGPVESGVEYPCASISLRVLPFCLLHPKASLQCIVLVRYKDAKKAKQACKKLDGKTLGNASKFARE